jgi:hypothetical protein
VDRVKKLTQDSIQHILDARGRTPEPDTAASWKMSVLLQSFNDPLRHHDELLKYYPMAVVAAMQGYFRARLADLIDKGEPYLTNAITFNPQIRVDASMAGAIAAGKLTFGQILMHSVSLNNFEELVSVLTVISGQKDVLTQIAGVAYRSFGVTAAKPLMSNPEEAWRQLGQVFDTRHILSHEIAVDLELNENETRELLTMTQDFIRASAEWIAQLIDPNKGVSIAEIQRRKAQEMETARSTVRKLFQRVTQLTRKIEGMDGSRKAVLGFQKSMLRLTATVRRSDRKRTGRNFLQSFEIDPAELALLNGVADSLKWLLSMLRNELYFAEKYREVSRKSKTR